MTILAHPFQQTPEAPRRIRIQASEPLFFQAFAQGYHIAETQYLGQPVTDDTIYGSIRRVMAQPELTPRWKAGAITGWFAALYHIPCRFDEATTPMPSAQEASRSRPIDLYYNDPFFLSAYEAGYQAFWAVVGDQPITDDGLYAELARDYPPTLDQQQLAEARWCAGYIAGFMAALFRVPCFVEDRKTTRSFASLERRGR